VSTRLHVRGLLAAVCRFGAAAIALACAGSLVVPAADAGSPPTWHRVVLGRSVEGRPIVAFHGRAGAAKRTGLVVGCIHGNECAGTAITAALLSRRPPDGVDLWVVPQLNPDGAAARTRGNAHRVDLNRNLPWHWRKLTGVTYSGRAPLSEPESRIAYRLILKLRPVVSIWFHQHLNLVDEAGGRLAIERRFAELAGLSLARLPRHPGSAISWQNAQLPGTTAFDVELPAGSLGAAAARRLAHAALAVAGPDRPAPPADLWRMRQIAEQLVRPREAHADPGKRESRPR
jgi:protein MpaA